MNKKNESMFTVGLMIVIMTIVFISLFYDDFRQAKMENFVNKTVSVSDGKIIELDFDVFTELDELSTNRLREFEYSGQETVFGVIYNNSSDNGKINITEAGEVMISNIKIWNSNTNITLEYITPENLKENVGALKTKDEMLFKGKMIRYDRDKRVLTLELTGLEVFSD